MKLFGAVLLAAASTAIGLLKALGLKSSVLTLRETISLLELVRNEICTRKTPLKQIFNCANLPDYRCITEFVNTIEAEISKLGNKTFAQIWCESIDEHLLPLSEKSRQALKNLGSSLGKYDAELQAASIDRCIDELTVEYSVLNEGLKCNEKMFIGLGTGIGLIFAIILI